MIKEYLKLSVTAWFFLCVSFFSSLVTTDQLRSAEAEVEFLDITHFVEQCSHSHMQKEKDILSMYIDLKGQILPEWMLQNIRSELIGFKPISLEDFEKLYFDPNQTYIHFKIRQGQVFGRVNNKEFHASVREFGCYLYKIMNCPGGGGIAAGDYLINLADGVKDLKTNYPVFCFSKNQDSNAIPMPDWFALSKDYEQTMALVHRATRNCPWDKKLSMAFWIGNANGGFHDNKRWKHLPRAALVLFSLRYPDYLWAKISLENHESAPNQELEILRTQLCHPRLPLTYAIKHKYLIDVDGQSSSFYRIHWIFRAGCLLIKQESENIQWFYSGMTPYIHYIPYKTDCSNLIEILTYLRDNDNEACDIAVAGQKFALKYLNTNMTYFYMFNLLQEQNKLNLIINTHDIKK